MRVAVVDDLRMDAENLRGMLDRRLPSGTFIDLYASGEAFLASQSRYDLIFLDIVMEGMDGIETARQFRARDMDCLIVFLTSSREYVWEAFPMHAFDYLVKPVEQERLDRVLEEAQRALACQERMLSRRICAACWTGRWGGSGSPCRYPPCAMPTPGIILCSLPLPTVGS